MRYPIKTLGIGGIIDVTVNLVKDRFSLFMGIMLAFYLPFVVLLKVVLLAIHPELSADPTTEEMQAHGILAANYESAAMGMEIAFFFLVHPLSYSAMMFAAANVYLGHPTTLGQSLIHGIRNYVAVAWIYFIVSIRCILGLLAFIVPGVIMFVSYAIAGEVVVIEKTKGLKALKRSSTLMRHPGSKNVTKLFGLLIAVWMISFGINTVAGFIPETYVRLAVSIFVETVLMIFATVAIVVFYFSARCEAEHFDLAFLASSIGADEPAQTNDVLEATR